MKNDWPQKAAWALVLPLLLAMETPSHRFHRSIDGATGWTALELPDDVLDAARPGLPDVRVLAENGEEVPYTLGALSTTTPAKVSLFDIEQSGKETTALVDRGAGAPRADSVELVLGEAEFIKPVTIDASNDRATWRKIGGGSIFATGTASRVRVTRVQFAPSDHRYWRLSLDDRNGPPLQVSEIVVGLAPTREEPRRMVPIALKPEPDVAPSTSTFSASLPNRNLRLTGVRLSASDAAFARRVRIFERVWFRDEVSRRLLGEGEIGRSPGGAEPSMVRLSEPTGQQLEIDVDRPGGVPLHDLSAEVAIEPRVLRFHAPEGRKLELVYGSPVSEMPSYDLAAALRSGLPALFTAGRLGSAIDTGATSATLPAVLRGSAIERAAWKNEQPIVLPARGPIAYLDIGRGAEAIDDVRVVDKGGRQVPYIVEKELRHARFPLTHRAEQKGTETRLYLEGLPSEKAIEAIELEIASPAYFTRQVSVIEPTVDERGVTAPRPLGNMRLVKTADQPTARFRIPVAAPRRALVEIIVDDGDNAPLVVKTATAEVARRRINFVFEPGDELRLLSGNDAAPAPSYDLALVAERVLSAPAEAATLGEARSIAPTPRPPTPSWFWVFVLAAAVILLLALARTLTGTPAKPT